jgi:tetratricopeptide (TPR) repeat protein
MIIALLLLLLQVTPELRQHIDAGLRSKKAGDLDTAAREFQRVVELAPNLAAAHVNLGAVYFEKKNYAAAIPALKKALELNANLPGAEGMLGAALLAQGFARESIPHLEKAGAQDLLGVALLESDRPREAVDRLEAALVQRPNDADILYYLSQAHGRLAKQLFDRLRQSNPESARVQQTLGEAIAASGNRESAEQHFHAALQMRPDLRNIHYALGDLYLETGEYEKAEAEFRAEKTLAPGSAATAYKLGLVLLNRGVIPEAVTELRRSDQLQPDMPETLLELGKAYSASGDAKAAAICFERVLKAEQDTKLAETAHFQLAQAYRKLGRTADAEQELKHFENLRRKR